MLQFQWPPPDVTQGAGGTQMNKFEQVSSDHHQMSLAGGSPGVMYGWWWWRRGVFPRSDRSYVLFHDAFDVTLPVRKQLSVKTIPYRKRICERK